MFKHNSLNKNTRSSGSIGQQPFKASNFNIFTVKEIKAYININRIMKFCMYI